MSPTKREILIEDMANLQKRLDWLQEHVSANDIWQNQLLWELTKYQHDMFDYILNKGEKNEKVSESNPQSASGEEALQEQQVCTRRVDQVSAILQRLENRRYEQGSFNP